MGEEIESCDRCSNYYIEGQACFCKECLTVDEMFNHWNVQKACDKFKDPAMIYIESKVW